jgi:hypothetical protein
MAIFHLFQALHLAQWTVLSATASNQQRSPPVPLLRPLHHLTGLLQDPRMTRAETSHP